MLPTRAFTTRPLPGVSHGWKGIGILYSLLFGYTLVWLVAIGLINWTQLTWGGDDQRVLEDFAPAIQHLNTALAASGDDPTTVKAAAFHALPSLRDAVQLFRAAGKRNLGGAVPQGSFDLCMLDLGVSRRSSLFAM